MEWKPIYAAGELPTGKLLIRSEEDFLILLYRPADAPEKPTPSTIHDLTAALFRRGLAAPDLAKESGGDHASNHVQNYYHAREGVKYFLGGSAIFFNGELIVAL